MYNLTCSVIGGFPPLFLDNFSIYLSSYLDFSLPTSHNLIINWFISFYIGLILIWSFFRLLGHLEKRSEYSEKICVICEILLIDLSLVPTLPIIIAIHASVQISRIFSSLYLRIRYKCKYTLMTGQDSFWTLEKFSQASSYTCLFIIKGDCDIGRIRKRFQERLLNSDQKIYDRMKRRAVTKGGFFCWERGSDFQLKNHIRFLHKDRKNLTESELFEEISKFVDIPLSNDKPPWEVLIVPKFKYDAEISKSDSKYAVLFRIGHSLMDGVSSGFILRNVLADEKVSFSVDPFKCPRDPIWKKICFILILLFLSPRIFFRTILLQERNIFHGPFITGPKFIGWSKPFDLTLIKKAKKETKSQTIAILISLLGKSLKNYGKIKGFKDEDLPQEINVASTVAYLPYPNMKPQNRFTLTLVPIRIKMRLKEMIQRAHESLTRLSMPSDIFLNYTMHRLIGRFPVFLIRFFSNKLHATAIVSNVPGPSEEIKIFEGDTLVEPVAWIPLKGRTAIGVSCFSYLGRMRAAFIADHTFIKTRRDIDILINEFERELHGIF